MTTKAKKPAVTMEEANGRLWIVVDGKYHGRVFPGKPLRAFLDPPHTAVDLRAIADFLDQLEGADLLSQVTP